MAWEQLANIAREAAIEAEAERNRPPTACPDDGEPLNRSPHGDLFCTYCGWRDDGT